jgi:DNA-directed RNA polymerase specialized sigma24 family protein
MQFVQGAIRDPCVGVISLGRMHFPDTKWTQLAEATLHGDTIAGQALEHFFLSYRGPVMSLLRRRGLLETRVEDLTQDFFLQLMKNSSLKRADRQEGRFRSYLSGALTKFMADDADRTGAAKRGGGVAPLSLDAGDGVGERLAGESPELALQLDREWALHLVARALETVRRRWEALEKPERFAVLRAFLPGAMELISQQEAARRLGLTNEALRTELQRLRESFRAAIRTEVAGTVGSPEDIAEEMRHLAGVLRSADARSEDPLSQSPGAS